MDEEFNEKMEKSNLGAEWEQNNRFYRFQRYDNNNSPFVEPESAETFADALIAVIALAVLMIVVTVGGWFYV